MQTQTQSKQGFTIIEVLIVLAIAGLILLIVFLAVPALQRNSRNQQYKNDAASYLAAATEFTNNNSGTIPTAGSSATSTTDAAKIKALTKAKSITTIVITTGTTSALAPTFDSAQIVTGVKCPTTVSGGNVTPTTASGRSIIIIYAVEDSAGAVRAQCTET